jgi:hypothetical protein
MTFVPEGSPTTMSPRELAYSGLFGAAALLLPGIFHLIHLGHVFMPMYLPLVVLGFFVGPKPAAATAFVVPLLSSALSGMPPFYPPVAPTMAIELSAMAAAIAAMRRRWPSSNEWGMLAVVLIFGRGLSFVLLYLCAKLMHLPAGFVAGLSLLSGWPGIVLMMIVVPSLVRSQRFLNRETEEVGRKS